MTWRPASLMRTTLMLVFSTVNQIERSMPSISARTALMVPPWATTAIVWPGWARASSSTVGCGTAAVESMPSSSIAPKRYRPAVTATVLGTEDAGSDDSRCQGDVRCRPKAGRRKPRAERSPFARRLVGLHAGADVATEVGGDHGVVVQQFVARTLLHDPARLEHVGPV